MAYLRPPCSFSWLTDSLPVTQHRPTRRRLQPAAIIRAAIVVLDVLRERPGKSKKPRANVRSLVGGDRGIRTLEPLNTTNTLAGCPYRPLRHDSTLRNNAQQQITVPRPADTACRTTHYWPSAGAASPENVTITAQITNTTPITISTTGTWLRIPTTAFFMRFTLLGEPGQRAVAWKALRTVTQCGRFRGIAPTMRNSRTVRKPLEFR